ncbi:MAG: flagellar hook-length control protein FliK, partial [Vicinamibacterales bacterium]
QLLASFVRTPSARKAMPAGAEATKSMAADASVRERPGTEKTPDLDGLLARSSESAPRASETATPATGVRTIRVQPSDTPSAKAKETGWELSTTLQAIDEGQTRLVLSHVARAFDQETPIARALKASLSNVEAAGIALPIAAAVSRAGEAALDAYGQLSHDSATLPPTTGPFEGQPHEQVIRAIRLQWQHGIGEARLTLQPESLGHVDVQLRVEQGAVTAVLRTETREAASWIRDHHADLRQALADQGLDLDSFEVVVDPDSRRRQSGRQRDEADVPPRHRRRPGVQSVFDIHV